MSLKVYNTTRSVRRFWHLFGTWKSETVRTLKRLARRGERRRMRRELNVPADDE